MDSPDKTQQHDLRRAYVEGKLARMAAGMDRRTFLKGSAMAAAAGLTVAPFTGFKPSAVSAASAVLQAGGNSADAAVEAAKQFAGITLNVLWEDGLQLQDPTLFSGPKWEEPVSYTHLTLPTKRIV